MSASQSRRLRGAVKHALRAGSFKPAVELAAARVREAWRGKDHRARGRAGELLDQGRIFTAALFLMDGRMPTTEQLYSAAKAEA